MRCAVIRNVSSPESDAERLADLKARKLDGGVVEALTTMFPQLSNLEPMSIGGQLMSWADVDNVPDLIPLPALGEGAARLTHLAMALLHVQAGVVIVDEVGNGLHHSKLKEMWRLIDHMSRKYRVQVVANTHSYECLEAMLDAKMDLADVRLHRLEVREGKNLAVTFGPEELQVALKKQLEVR